MSHKLLSDAQVASELKTLTAANRIAWTRHSEERMASRGFDKSQVKECLKNGIFTERPTNPNQSTEIEYKFRVEAVVDGDLIAVAASLIPSKRVIVITVFAVN